MLSVPEIQSKVKGRDSPRKREREKERKGERERENDFFPDEV